jgi:hypothetical protein
MMRWWRVKFAAMYAMEFGDLTGFCPLHGQIMTGAEYEGEVVGWV